MRNAGGFVNDEETFRLEEDWNVGWCWYNGGSGQAERR